MRFTILEEIKSTLPKSLFYNYYSQIKSNQMLVFDRKSDFILNISQESYLWGNSWRCNSLSPGCLLYIFCHFPVVSDWCMFSRVSFGQRRRSYCTHASWTIGWSHHRYLGSGDLDLGRKITWHTTPWMLHFNWRRLGESPLIDLWNQPIYSLRYPKKYSVSIARNTNKVLAFLF